MIEKLLPYLVAFFGSLVLTLILTPLVREMNRRLGMVDKPDPRRINKVPIPRGGGLALFIGVVSTALFIFAVYGSSAFGPLGPRLCRMIPLAAGMVAIGYADDKFGMNPKVKLLGQLVIALLTWWWGDLGFRDLWPTLPAWLDAILTVFWIAGAINAFNLIDGLDGLASGLALIATAGMAGSLFFTGHTTATLFYFIFAGGLLGFLRYNYNPASVFLGDSGSMLIGFVLAVLPLNVHTANSFLVSVGVPLLAMGVPIFDTSLAIIRRSVRRLLKAEGGTTGNAEVMTADTDHLHHRILRAAGLNQRKAAWTLYALAAFFVGIGLVGISLQSRAAGLWMAAVAVAAVVIFRDMSRVELFDVGLLLGRVAHSQDISSRRRWAKLAVPFYLVTDVALLLLAMCFSVWAVKEPLVVGISRITIPVRIATIFAALVFFRVYVTIWSRAVISNFVRLFLACCGGSILGSVILYYMPSVSVPEVKGITIIFALTSFIFLSSTRIIRSVIRDVFYAIDRRQLVGRKDVSRILVYGTGLRYRAFRRELVRSTAASTRMIVGLLDDDLLLRGHYIGGCQVMGTLQDAPAVINRLNVDAIVIAFAPTEEWMDIIRKTLKPTGVKLTQFSLHEKEI